MEKDYTYYIKNIVEYIDCNLDKRILVDELCEGVPYSKVQLCRIFYYLTGFTFNQYIKTRKLSEAALDLIHTDKSIIEVGMDYGYDSQEAFTRAFKKIFRVTPGIYRRKRLLFSNQILRKIKINRKFQGGKNMEPKKVKKESFYVVGFKYYGNAIPDNAPGLWNELMRKQNEIKNIYKPVEWIGLMCTGEEEFVDEKADYIAGARVTDLSSIPEGMRGYEVPAREYLVFTHKGTLDKLGETYNYIYSQYFPACREYTPTGMMEFEYYDQRFVGDKPESEFDIYIPVEKKKV
ncbi:MAG: AraC family transcriptional regulator [Kosmotogales bacterium]|nr:AraC family transcriptional regulator [Kosmotogales bacterium]